MQSVAVKFSTRMTQVIDGLSRSSDCREGGIRAFEVQEIYKFHMLINLIGAAFLKDNYTSIPTGTHWIMQSIEFHVVGGAGLCRHWSAAVKMVAIGLWRSTGGRI